MKWIASIFAILLIFAACEDTPTDSPYSHNASIEGYVQFEEATTDTLSANVEVYFTTDSDETIKVAETTTDQTGYWRVDGLTADEYFIYFYSDTYGSTNATATAVANEITMVDTVTFEYSEPIEFREITVDGDSTDWDQPIYENNHASDWGPNNFENLYMAQNETHLFICLTGEFSSSDNAVNIYLDTDFVAGIGVRDFSTIAGGDPGNQLRKNVVVNAPEAFGADVALTNWALQNPLLVSLADPTAVDSNVLEAEVAMTASCIELAIPFEQLYGSSSAPSGQKIALVAIIGGGGDAYFAGDSIPQQTNVASFQSVIEAMLSE